MVGAIFVDGGNMSHALKDVSPICKTRINYTRIPHLIQKRLLDKHNVKVEFLYLCYYDAYRNEDDLKRRSPFHATLRKHGWSVFSFQAKECSDGMWRDKGLDIALALDAYRLATSGGVSHVVLLSHDEDFVSLFERLPNNVVGISVGWRGKTALRIQKAASIAWFLEDFGMEAIRKEGR